MTDPHELDLDPPTEEVPAPPPREAMRPPELPAVRLVYIAGPYRAATTWQIACNIHAARLLGARVAELGAYPVIPHSNTAHFDGLATDELWLEGTKELMRRCDAVLFSARWTSSSGSRGEYAEAERLKLPMFGEGHLESGDLEAWLRGGAAP